MSWKGVFCGSSNFFSTNLRAWCLLQPSTRTGLRCGNGPSLLGMGLWQVHVLSFYLPMSSPSPRIYVIILLFWKWLAGGDSENAVARGQWAGYTTDCRKTGEFHSCWTCRQEGSLCSPCWPGCRQDKVGLELTDDPLPQLSGVLRCVLPWPATFIFPNEELCLITIDSKSLLMFCPVLVFVVSAP